ncbi:hypothetical protein [Deinococcus kurensis]|uniref:hypothetical protein n=1 Tax=Deinococcus kurensis TaxID=2662757 RepID=UPI0012D347C7|nr:hypothetical protein [Deinococcus kurensis]
MNETPALSIDLNLITPADITYRAETTIDGYTFRTQSYAQAKDALLELESTISHYTNRPLTVAVFMRQDDEETRILNSPARVDLVLHPDSFEAELVTHAVMTRNPLLPVTLGLNAETCSCGGDLIEDEPGIDGIPLDQTGYVTASAPGLHAIAVAMPIDAATGPSAFTRALTSQAIRG